MIVASGTGEGHVTVQTVPTLPGVLTTKNEAGDYYLPHNYRITDEKPVFKTILHLFTQASLRASSVI